MEINGWVSNLTKNTASVRMNFDADATDEQIYAAVLQAVAAELRRHGRAGEATAEQWQLKVPIKRDYAIIGRSSARIRLVRRFPAGEQLPAVPMAELEAESAEIAALSAERDAEV